MTAPTETSTGQRRLVAVADLGEIPTGWVLKVRAEGREIALARSDGAVHAFDNACPHAAGPLGDTRLREGCYVECPWHNSVFDVRTGDVLRGPARKPLRSYEVTVAEGTVYIALD